MSDSGKVLVAGLGKSRTVMIRLAGLSPSSC